MDVETFRGISMVMHTEHRVASRNPEATCNSRRCIHLAFGYPIFSKYSKYFRYQKRLEAFASVETLRSDVSLRSVNKIYSCRIYCLLSPAYAVIRKILLTVFLSTRVADGADRSSDISATMRENRVRVDNKKKNIFLL